VRLHVGLEGANALKADLQTAIQAALA